MPKFIAPYVEQRSISHIYEKRFVFIARRLAPALMFQFHVACIATTHTWVSYITFHQIRAKRTSANSSNITQLTKSQRRSIRPSHEKGHPYALNVKTTSKQYINKCCILLVYELAEIYYLVVDFWVQILGMPYIQLLGAKRSIAWNFQDIIPLIHMPS